MAEFDQRKSFLALPANGNELRQTADYIISLPSTLTIQTRIRLCNAVSKAIQQEADKMKFEDFFIASKKG